MPGKLDKVDQNQLVALNNGDVRFKSVPTFDYPEAVPPNKESSVPCLTTETLFHPLTDLIDQFLPRELIDKLKVSIERVSLPLKSSGDSCVGGMLSCYDER